VQFDWENVNLMVSYLLQTMLDKEKKRFHEMAENDKKRYDDEMKNYIPPKGEKQRGKKRKQIKDPNAPKRSL
jgi:high mobility group protein B1